MFDPSNEMQQINPGQGQGNAWEFMDVELNKPFDTNAENSGYKACLTCFGKCQIGTKYLCASCGCGPIVVIEQGSVGLKLRFGKYVSKLKPGLYTYNTCTEEIQVVDMRA
jgi:erythrocyte band 7 integral membrane protein